MPDWVQWWMWPVAYFVIGALVARYGYAEEMKDFTDDAGKPRSREATERSAIESAWLLFFLWSLALLALAGCAVFEAVVWFFTGRHRKIERRKIKEAEKEVAALRARTEAVVFWTKELTNASSDAEAAVARTSIEILRSGEPA